jgi:hypothetical protein
MIAKLRTRHRRLWWALALLVPTTLAFALWTRRPPVMMDKLPPGLADSVVEEAKP